MQLEFAVYLRLKYNLPIFPSVVLEIPIDDNMPSTICAELLGQLVSDIIISRVPELSDPRVISIDERKKCYASSLPQICSWIGEKLGYSHSLQMLCGRSPSERRLIRRGIRECLNWSVDWLNYKDDPRIQMENPVCAQRLLERQLRHHQMRFMSDYNRSGCGRLPRHCPSMEDITLLSFVHPWLTNLSQYSEYFITSIPAIISYIQRMKVEIYKMNLPINYHHYHFLTSVTWIDHSNIPFPLSSFHFAPTKAEKKTMKDIKDDRNHKKTISASLLRKNNSLLSSTRTNGDGKIEVVNGSNHLVNVTMPSIPLNSTSLAKKLISLVDWSLCKVCINDNSIRNINNNIKSIKNNLSDDDDDVAVKKSNDIGMNNACNGCNNNTILNDKLENTKRLHTSAIDQTGSSFAVHDSVLYLKEEIEILKSDTKPVSRSNRFDQSWPSYPALLDHSEYVK